MDKNFLHSLIYIGSIILCIVYANYCQGKTEDGFSPAGGLLVKYKQEKDPRSVNPESVAGGIAALQNDPLVEFIEPDFKYKIAIIKYDFYYRNQWYLQKIKAPESWEIISESPSVTIAVIDTGVDISHPDLKENIWTNEDEIAGNGIDDDDNGYIDDVNGWDFVYNQPDPGPKFEGNYTEDGITHGTIVAGIAAARGGNGEGIFGVTWRAKIMALKALDGSGEGSTGNVVRAINYAVKNGANIINLSFVGSGNSINLENAIRDAHNAGLILVAAAGNEQSNDEGYDLRNNPMYPVCYDGPGDENWVIGVAATDAIDQKAVFSSYGFSCVDITAPGISIFSTVPYRPKEMIGNKIFNIYYDGYWSGTSVAVPMVSAAMALAWQAAPFMAGQDIGELVLTAADNIYRVNPNYLGQLGRGRLNLLNSAKLASAKTKSYENYFAYVPYAGFPAEIKLGGATDNSLATSSFYAYNPNFRGGASLTAAHIGSAEELLITGAGPGGGPHVRIFTREGKLGGQFFAYGKDFKGGVSVAAGDINGDGIDEIITGAGPGGGPQVRIFDGQGINKGQFSAFGNNFRGGVKVAAGDVAILQDGLHDEIICAPWKNGAPHIRIFSHSLQAISQFYAYSLKFKGGVNLAVGDSDNDGRAEIITGAGDGGSPHVKVFDSQGILKQSFYAFDSSQPSGVEVALLRSNISQQPFE